jgi:transposase InsO family protein
MSYTSSPYAPKARFDAARLVVKGGMRKSQVARMYGVHRATIGKWVSRFPGKTRKLNQYGHYIDTLSSAPNHHPKQTSDEVVSRIIELRGKLKGRCAPVIHAHLILEGYKISVRTVGRVLRREGLIRKKKQSRFLKSIYLRPEAKLPGDLVQMDTIHVVRSDHSKYYIFCLIDLYSRLAYAQYSTNLKQSTSYVVVKNGQKYLKFNFKMIQTDHGPEFRDGFTYQLSKSSIKLRHSRIRHPNDNAHVERFNRTLQEECFNSLPPKEKTIEKDLKDYLEYYNKERLHLSLSLQTPTAFVAKVLS